MNQVRMILMALTLLLVLASPIRSGEVSPALPDGADAAGYSLGWWTVDGGGSTSGTANGYALGGTMGQPDAAVLATDSLGVRGGFWGGATLRYDLFLPTIFQMP